MISDREMNSFVDFIFRRHNAKKRNRGDVIEIVVKNEPIATYFIKKNGKIKILYDAKDETSRKFRELVRFKLAMNNTKPIFTDNQQCTRKTCYQYLIDDFKKEWELFMNYGNNQESSFIANSSNKHTTSTSTSNNDSHKITETQNEKCKNGQCFLEVLKDFNDQLNNLLD